MTQATVTADPSQPPGYALVRIPGRAASGLADPRFRLTRDGYEAGTLGPGGWQIADTLLAPLSARAEGADLLLAVGPAVVDRVESGVVLLAVPAAQYNDPVFWPDLPLSRGGHADVTVASPSKPVAPEPPKPPPPPREETRSVEPPSIDPRPVQPPPIPPRPGLRNPRPFMLGGAALIAIAGAGSWMALRPRTPEPVPQHAPPAPAPAASRDCGQGSISEMVACAPDADGLYAVAQRRWAGGKTDQGLVLMQIAADRGSGQAALRLAQLYDPDGFRSGGPIPQANARQAALYYRKAAQAHQEAATAPREALHQKLQRDADGGDTLAGLTVKDYWP